MKITPEYFEAITYLFEQRNGNKLVKYQLDLIEKYSGIKAQSNEQIEENIVSNLESKSYDSELRISAYWSLSKLHKKELVPLFQKWLKEEFGKCNAGQVYQLSIALSNLGEPVFSRSGTAIWEEKENLDDAKSYLDAIARI